MNHRAMEDHMMLMSQLYPGAYTQITPQQGETKPRRRRSRKNKGGENGAEGAIKKRKLSAEQVSLLEQNFGNEHKLHSEKKDRLALELGLDPRQVAVWFQNRRARWKNKKLEEEYSNLKNAHETTVTEKCHLETEVLRLKEQLLQAEKEIQWQLERAHRALSTVDPPFLGDFGVKGYDDVVYIPETPHINGMEWINLYCEPKENAGICR